MNSNTSEAMTEDILETVLAIKNLNIEIEVIHPDFSVQSLESFYD